MDRTYNQRVAERQVKLLPIHDCTENGAPKADTLRLAMRGSSPGPD